MVSEVSATHHKHTSAAYVHFPEHATPALVLQRLACCLEFVNQGLQQQGQWCIEISFLPIRNAMLVLQLLCDSSWLTFLDPSTDSCHNIC